MIITLKAKAWWGFNYVKFLWSISELCPDGANLGKVLHSLIFNGVFWRAQIKKNYENMCLR